MNRYVAFDDAGLRRYGRLEGERVQVLTAAPWEGGQAGTDSAGVVDWRPMAGLRLLAPVLPGKAVCVGLNYRNHAAEMGEPLPRSPLLFLKPSTAVIGPEEVIEYPRAMSERVDYEAELAVVIGRRCRQVRDSEAGDYIFGYTCANDVTARDLQKRDGQWTRAKSFDTFLPLGPYIVSGLDPSDLRIQARLNGQVRQDSTTAELVFNVPQLVAFISQVMTLEPGDVILTGTPPGIGPMQPGDEIEIEIAQIGVLRNRVG